MKRHQLILVGVLALQVVLAVVLLWPHQAASVTGEPVFPGVTTDAIVSLTITDNTGAQISLRKVDGAWALPDAGNYPANESTITPLLDKIVALDTSTLVAKTEASQRSLQVSDDTFQRRLDFETQDGKSYTVYLGSAPRYTATHFRVAGEQETYLSDNISSWEFGTAATGWIDTTYGTIDQDTVTSVTLENANGTFQFVKDGDNWTLADLAADETIAAGKTLEIVRNACGLTLQMPLGTEAQPDYGLDQPTAVVTLQTSDGATHVLQIGAQGPDGTSYIVKSSDSPYYVRVAEYSLSGMVGYARADFLQVPGTATPAP